MKQLLYIGQQILTYIALIMLVVALVFQVKNSPLRAELDSLIIIQEVPMSIPPINTLP